MHVGIIGFGNYLPSGRLTAADLAAATGIPEDVIALKFGVKSKPVAGPDETTAFMGLAAARNALADMRRLVTIGDTDPPTTLEAQPRMATLHQLVQRLTDSGTEVHLDQQGPWTDVPLGTDLALFRITQEAVTNAINHAPGAAIHIRVVDRDGFVATDITNGTATRPDPGPGSGRGLLGMRERVQLYGGTLQTGPRPDGGYQVHAALPTTAATR